MSGCIRIGGILEALLWSLDCLFWVKEEYGVLVSFSKLSTDDFELRKFDDLSSRDGRVSPVNSTFISSESDSIDGKLKSSRNPGAGHQFGFFIKFSNQSRHHELDT